LSAAKPRNYSSDKNSTKTLQNVQFM
jgi:hypothetical protein